MKNIAPLECKEGCPVYKREFIKVPIKLKGYQYGCSICGEYGQPARTRRRAVKNWNSYVLTKLKGD